jgi:hypothetical protein
MGIFISLKKIRNIEMRSSLEHYPTDRKISHYPQFLIAYNWILSCNQNPDAISFIDSPQGGGPMK